MQTYTVNVRCQNPSLMLCFSVLALTVITTSRHTYTVQYTIKLVLSSRQIGHPFRVIGSQMRLIQLYLHVVSIAEKCIYTAVYQKPDYQLNNLLQINVKHDPATLTTRKQTIHQKHKLSCRWQRTRNSLACRESNNCSPMRDPSLSDMSQCCGSL